MSGDALLTGFSKIFLKIHRKTPVLWYLFNKIAGCPATLFYGTEVYLWILQNICEQLFCRTSTNSCFWSQRSCFYMKFYTYKKRCGDPLLCYFLKRDLIDFLPCYYWKYCYCNFLISLYESLFSQWYFLSTIWNF